MSGKSGLTAWERWELASFDDEATVDHLVSPRDSGLGSAQPLSNKQAGTGQEAATSTSADAAASAPAFSAEEIAELKVKAREEGFAEGRAAGHAEGLAQGLDEGRAKGEAAAAAHGQEQAQRLAGLIAQLQQQLAALDDTVATDLLDLALAVARGVIGQQLRVAPESVATTVRQALTLLPVQHANIQLHPDDLALVREHAGDALAHGAHRLHENPALARGDVLLDAGGSHLDATLAARWQRVLFMLGRGDPLETTTPAAEPAP